MYRGYYTGKNVMSRAHESCNNETRSPHRPHWQVHFILCIYTHCTVVLLYYCIMTNALHTYAECVMCSISVKIYGRWINMIWYDMIHKICSLFTITQNPLVFNIKRLVTLQQSNYMLLFAFFWVIPQSLNFICRRFEHCSIFIGLCSGNRQCSETSAYKIQMPGNYPEESIQHSEHGESLKSKLHAASR
jgi:hypothetical protein